MTVFSIFVVIVTVFFGISFACLALNFVTNKDYGASPVDATPRVAFLAAMYGGALTALIGTLGFVYLVGNVFEGVNPELINAGVIYALVGGFLTPIVALVIPRH